MNAYKNCPTYVLEAFCTLFEAIEAKH